MARLSEKALPYLTPSLADIFFASLLLAMLFLPGGGGMLNDGDSGYHIRAGEFMVDTGRVLTEDIFSFHEPPIPWTAHEWLAEAVMYLLHSKFGLTGVVFFFICLTAFYNYLLLRFLRSLSGSALATIVIMILAVGSSTIHWLARPHMFSFPLFIGWYFLLDQHERDGKNLLFLLPLTFVLWINLHGGYIAGLFLLVLYLLHSALGLFTAEQAEKALWAGKTRQLLVTFIACLALSGLNPQGYHLLAFPFTLTGNAAIMDNVSEWLSPNFHENLIFKYYLLLLLVLMAVKRRAFSFLETSLVLLFTYMSLYSVRYIPLFSIVVAPVMLRHSREMNFRLPGPVSLFLSRRDHVLEAVDRSARGFLWPAATVLAGLLLVGALGLHYSFDETIHPVEAVEFLRGDSLPGHPFNNDEYGDYLIYAAWPQYKVFFDGRSDMYGAEMIREYFDIIHLREGMEDVFRKYDINWVFYDRKSPLSYFLQRDDGWRLIYSDKMANIFIRDLPENARIVNKYRFVRSFRD